MLARLKIEMTKFSVVVSGELNQETQKEMLLARTILETATLLSAKLKDFSGFERHISQLKPYYDILPSPESPLRYTILGLNLLRLLAETKLADFHTELELIPVDMLDNSFIKHPIQLEQFLMEGSYSKITGSTQDVPSQYYSCFMPRLIDTVRDEIVACTVRAYRDLKIADAAKLLMFSKESDFRDYAEGRMWTIDGDRVIFEQDQETESDIPTQNLITRTLLYAKELERIV